MSQQPEPFQSFIAGDIRHAGIPTEKEFYDALRAIEALMIEHNILKLDVSINPHYYPRDLLYRNP